MSLKGKIVRSCFVLVGLTSPSIASESISERCAEYAASLEKLDCPESFKAIDTFMKTNRSAVMELASGTEKSSVIAYRNVIAKTSEVIKDCLVKHTVNNSDPKTKALTDAQVKFTSFRANIDYWAKRGTLPANRADGLMRNYDKAAKAVAVAAGQW